jgi:hypothetical protein
MKNVPTVKEVAAALSLKFATIRVWVSRRKLKRLTLWLSLVTAVGKFVQVMLSLFHGSK